MPKHFLIKSCCFLFIALFCSNLSEAQDANNLFAVDMFVGSSQKAFKSRKVKRYSLWERIENDCPLEVPFELNNAFEGVPRHAQSSFYDLMKGNVKISNQIISPTERQFLQSDFLQPNISSEIFGCLTGISYREETFVLNNVDYFNLVIENLYYLQEELQYSYHTRGRVFNCKIITNPDQIPAIMESPTDIGIVVSIHGGHALGNYLYIEQGQYQSSEYKNILINNIDRLKGTQPLRVKTNEFLEIPIFSISFGNYFEDGICGKAAKFSLAEEEAFKEQDNMGNGVSALGEAVIRRLLSKETGRRILLDVSDMSLAAREWYYKFVKDQRYGKDTIPILALNTGVSGLSTKDNAYIGNDEKLKNQQSYLNNRQANLSRQDIREIVRSEGLIGISLDRDRLMGKAFQTRYNSTLEGSADRRRVAIDAIVANICEIIQTAQTIDAWDMICIGSSFDNLCRPMEMFATSADMEQLAKELLDFFENPRDIEGIYTEKEIKQFMYSYSARDIVDRIMYQNALNFLKKHLPKIEIP
jgi:hypothetical protein